MSKMKTMSGKAEHRPEGKGGNRSPAREQKRDDEPNAGQRQGGGDTGRQSENDHQKTVQGKNQSGPDDKAGRDVGGGNAGSKGQNIDERRNQDEHTGKKSGT